MEVQHVDRIEVWGLKRNYKTIFGMGLDEFVWVQKLCY